MLGTLDSTKPSASIIGGGVSGLLIAHALAKRGWVIDMHEASDRFGGMIQTQVTSQGIVENAAHSLLASEEVELLFHELGLKLMPLKNKERFILRNHRLKRMPLSLREGFFLLIRFVFSRSHREGTVENWARHRLGEPALNYLVKPFLRGIYAARPHELSMQAVFPAPKKRPKKRLKMNPKKREMKAPEFGMQSLIDALVTVLKKNTRVSLHLNSTVTELPTGAVNTIMTTPAPVSARLIQSRFPDLALSLEKIQYAPLITATVFYRSEDCSHKIKGVGVLIPEVEADYRVLGILFNSSSFDGRSKDGSVSFTVMLGGTSHPEYLDLNDAELSQIIDEDLKKILNINAKPSSVTITRWKNAIPLYNDALLETWTVAQNAFQNNAGVVLFSNYTGQVSIRGLIESLAVLPFDKIK